ncbi:hypothetical protein Fot_37803 [Forsythia ovata]|uniref:Uncharacterized protein n=1 Tax=Forsythia ovata TaxID=205694 RepID=A0ABD1S006_9LAMI
MAVTSPGKKCKGGSTTTCLIGSNVQLKCLVRKVTENQGLEDQVCPYKCPDCTSDQWSALNTLEGVGPSSLSENGHYLVVINDEGKKAMPKRGMEDEDSVGDSRKAKRGRETLIRRAGKNTHHPRAAASVNKYWTSAFVKTVNNAELLEMLKLAEMYTSRSHVLNYELYKVLAMKIGELHSTVVSAKDINKLRSENKIFHLRLAVSEDTRVKAEYKISMAETIQKLSI